MSSISPIKPLAPIAPVGGAGSVADAAKGAPQQDPVQMQNQQAEQDLKMQQQQQESQNLQAQQNLKLQQAQQAHSQEMANRKAAENNAKTLASGFGKVTTGRLKEVKSRVDRLFAGSQNSHQDVFRLKLAMVGKIPTAPKVMATPEEIVPRALTPPSAPGKAPEPPKAPEPADWLDRTPAGTHSPISKNMFSAPAPGAPETDLQNHAWAPGAAAERYIRHVGQNKADPNFAVDFFAPRYGPEAAQAIGQHVQKLVNQQNQAGVLADQTAAADRASWSSNGIDENYWPRIGAGVFDAVTGADVMERQRSQATQLPYYGSNLTPAQRLANTRARVENLTSTGGQEKVWRDSAGLNINDQGEMLENFGRMAFEPDSRASISDDLEQTDAPALIRLMAGGTDVLLGAEVKNPTIRRLQKILQRVPGLGGVLQHGGPLYRKMLRSGLLQTMSAHGDFSDASRAYQAGQKWDAAKEFFTGSADAFTAPFTALPTRWFGDPLTAFSTVNTMFGNEAPTSAELAQQPKASPAPANQVEQYQAGNSGLPDLSGLDGMLPALVSGIGGGGSSQPTGGGYYDSPEFYGGSMAHLNKSSNRKYQAPGSLPLPEIQPPQTPTPQPQPLTQPKPPMATPPPQPSAPPPPLQSAVPAINAPGGGMPSVANEQFRSLGQLPPVPGIPEPSPWLQSIGNVAWSLYGPGFQRRPQSSIFDGLPTAPVNPAFHEAARAANYANRTVPPWMPGPSQQVQLLQNFAPQLLPLAQGIMIPQE